MAKQTFPDFNVGDDAHKVLNHKYQNAIVKELRRFSQLNGPPGHVSTGPAEMSPRVTSGPLPIINGKLTGAVASGVAAKYGYETGVIAVQVPDRDDGRPDDQADERRFVVTGFDPTTRTISIDGKNSAKFTAQHEVWLRGTETLPGTNRDGDFTVEKATDVIAGSTTDVIVNEEFPSILDGGEEVVSGDLWLWSSFELESTINYIMVVNRSSSVFNKDDLVEAFWVDGEYVIIGASSVIHEGYLITELLPADDDGDDVTPTTAQMAIYRHRADGLNPPIWERAGQMTIDNMSVDASGEVGTYCRAVNLAGFWRLDWIDCSVTDASNLDLTDNS